MKVRNVVTGEEFFIRPEDADKVGKRDMNVPVYFKPPPPKAQPGCKHYKAGEVHVFACSRKNWQKNEEDHDKIFKSDWLELVTEEEADS